MARCKYAHKKLINFLNAGCPRCHQCQEWSGILEIFSKSQENVRKIFHISNLSGKFQGYVRNFWFCLVVVHLNLMLILIWYVSDY